MWRQLRRRDQVCVMLFIYACVRENPTNRHRIRTWCAQLLGRLAHDGAQARFKSYDEMNAWLLDKCIAYAKAHRHPELSEQTI